MSALLKRERHRTCAASARSALELRSLDACGGKSLGLGKAWRENVPGNQASRLQIAYGRLMLNCSDMPKLWIEAALTDAASLFVTW